MTMFCALMLAASVRAGEMVLPSYGFADPDPVPRTAADYYPYFRYDSYAVEPEKRRWQTVELESDRMKITIVPEVGGKVWGAYDKKSGIDFIYFNHVAKFRDIAMRGPWSSGGIEFNFGKMGHAPYVSAPVEWHVRTNADGSVSCLVGGTEWLCRSLWQVEVRLVDGEDRFTTHTTWFNASGMRQPYYQWMNAAFHGGGETHYFFPGMNWIGHGGEAHAWPVEDGHDLSVYSQNAIPGYLEDHRAMHVINGDNRYFGVWWPHLAVGALHENRTDEKYGRKIWMWGLSRQGAIWEGLLTDADGPYVELQSGRGLQQPNANFWRTPFKFGVFEPGITDSFVESWRVVRSKDYFSQLDVHNFIKPRPVHMPRDFKWKSAYGLYLKGVQKLREGKYSGFSTAETALKESLGIDPCFILALDTLACLYVSQARFDEARGIVDKALAVDTYDDMANYLAGLLAWEAADYPTARERFGLAAFSPRVRSAALANSARIALAERRWGEARDLAERALEANTKNLDANAVLIVAARKSGDKARALGLAAHYFRMVPVCHQFRYELEKHSGADFADGIRSEFPEKTLVELAIWYERSGLFDEAMALYAMAPKSIEALTRAAHLLYRTGNTNGANATLKTVIQLDIGYDFPFRWESYPAFTWAAELNGHWKFNYMASLFLASRGRDSEANALLDACANAIDDPNALMYRASRREVAEALWDLEKARKISDSWRVGLGLFHAYAKCGDWQAACRTLEGYNKRFPGNPGLELNYARALVKTGAYEKAVAFLEGISILPSELGEKPITIYQDALGVLAERALKADDRLSARQFIKKALSFPETLGVGRQYRLDAVLDRWPRRVADFARTIDN